VLLLVTITGWSEDPESYARGSIATGRGSHAEQVKGEATGRGSHAEQVKGDDPNMIPWSSRLGAGRGADTTTL
jgi:hypothetical protein